MLPLTGDEMSKLLDDGWEVSGYSVCMMALGALAHNVLLRKENKLTTVTIMTNNGKELGRSAYTIAPTSEPAPKKGFFG